MTTFRSDELFMGIVSLAAAPWILWTVQRGVRLGKLPIGRDYVLREERAGAFNVLLALYIVAAAMMAFIGLDLLFGITL